MLGYLRGVILEQAPGQLLVGVGSAASGMLGYEVAVTSGLALTTHSSQAPSLGQEIELFLYTHVREEAFDLYGFHNRVEKAIFLSLLSVSGIGPKSALAILSAVAPLQLVDAIIRGDQRYLNALPGVGKKTAERLVVELRDSLQKRKNQGDFLVERAPSLQVGQRKLGSGSGGSAEAFPLLLRAITGSGDGLVGAEGDHETGPESSPEERQAVWCNDAHDALVGLGYRPFDVQQMLHACLSEPGFKPQGAQDLVRQVLRALAQRSQDQRAQDR